MRTALFTLKLLPVLWAVAVAWRKAVDKNGVGGMWIEPSERPEINRTMWLAYDKATKYTVRDSTA